jgi:hypothetical protein
MANATYSFKSRIWCDAATGLVLKQIFDQKMSNLVTHEELFIAETGIEEIKPGLADLLPTIIAPITIVIAVAGIAIYLLKFRRKKGKTKIKHKMHR